MNKLLKYGIKTINLTAIALMPALGFLVLSNRASIGDPGGCFMVTSSGETVELSRICATTTATTSDVPSEDKVFRVPIKRRYGGTPIVEVTFNNKKTFEMIVDTGASATVITRNMANSLQLKTTGIMEAQIADGSEVRLATSKVKSITVGEVVANNLQVAIAPQADIGLLGHDFFGKYDIKILEKEVEFYHR
ncbi:MAG: retropepsin-like aspartic protease [Nostoc sp. ChiSLP02]|nr:retropepsin-like aspartic protease [Nostoc sp. DedSLP05]MDZ8098835.1 retropepsin-like aspartic protease [Nostoc sp. DedSLP01]MDZ8183550.1 retropepsin-like aspartic protease [Nostoc sp. ChiSLP02]